jgi:uncharacterized membrane protein
MNFRYALVILTATASLSLNAPPATAHPDDGGGDRRHRCTPSVRALPDLGVGRAVTSDFNRHRVFVGDVDHPDGRTLPAYWDRAGLHTIDVDSRNGRAMHINDRGTIVGDAIDPVTDQGFAWVWEKGRVHRLRGLGGDVVPLDLNDRGTIVGLAFEPKGPGRAVRWSSWRAEPEVLPQLNALGGAEARGINNRGTMVGRVIEGTFDAQFPVAWNRRGRIRPLPDDPSRNLVIGLADAINERGQITGGMSTTEPTVPFTATRWWGGRVTIIGNLPGDNNTAGSDIANNGWVVGGSERIGPDGRRESRKGFFWSGRGPIQALPPLTGDWATTETNAFAIDSRGTVAGYTEIGEERSRATVWTCIQRSAFTPPAATATTSPADKLTDQPWSRNHSR